MTPNEHLAQILLAKGFSLSVAESCTGGLLGASITSLAGSSRYFRGGIIAYDNEIKQQLLQVSRTLLDSKGAVSAPVVEQMASGVAKLFATDCSIAISGVAGPGGGTAEKPVGLVYIGIHIRGAIQSFACRFEGDREEIRKLAVSESIRHLIALIQTDF